MRLKALIQKDADLRTELGTLRAAAKDRTYTADEKTRVKAIDAELDGLAEELALERKAQERERQAQPVVDPEQATTARAEANASIQVGRDRAEADPKRGFT